MMIMLQETVERINELVLLKQVFIATNEAAFVKRKMYHPTNRIVYHLV
ncbi:MAG: hypothetical protein CI949_4094 [Halanaerobium sp.]|nr:MAG: hypothetical protein CI949_4094 [Halanaerobium sp.]